MGEHALLSASGAERWMNCPPSARLEEMIDEKSSIYAKEGRTQGDSSFVFFCVVIYVLPY